MKRRGTIIKNTEGKIGNDLKRGAQLGRRSVVETSPTPGIKGNFGERRNCWERTNKKKGEGGR